MRSSILALGLISYFGSSSLADVVKLTMSDVEFKTNAAQSPGNFFDLASVQGEFNYTLEVFEGGGSVDAVPGNFVQARVRYSAIARRFALTKAAAASRTFTNSYELSFGLEGLPENFPYPVRVDVISKFAGEGNRVAGASDVSLSGSTISNVSYITNLYNTTGSMITIPDIGVPPFSPAAPGFNAANSTIVESAPFQRAGLYGVVFSYDMDLLSSVTDDGSGADVAFRLGQFSGFDGGAAAYPGINNRSALDDGHFITVRVTVIPEASPLPLLGSVLIITVGGLTIARRYRSTKACSG